MPGLSQPVLGLVPDAPRLQQRFSTCSIDVCAVVDAADAQPVRDVLVDALGERVGLLEHHADPHADFDRVDARADEVQLVGVQDDLALVAVVGVQVVHAVEAAQQRALAAAAGADQRGDAVLGDGHVDVLQRLERAVVEAEVADLGLDRAATAPRSRARQRSIRSCRRCSMVRFNSARRITT